jgi:hypothetical protein
MHLMNLALTKKCRGGHFGQLYICTGSARTIPTVTLRTGSGDKNHGKEFRNRCLAVGRHSFWTAVSKEYGESDARMCTNSNRSDPELRRYAECISL